MQNFAMQRYSPCKGPPCLSAFAERLGKNPWQKPGQEALNLFGHRVYSDDFGEL